MRFRERDQFSHVLRRQRRMGDDHAGKSRHEADRRKIAVEVVAQVLEEAHADRVRRARHQQGVAVRCRRLRHDPDQAGGIVPGESNGRDSGKNDDSTGLVLHAHKLSPFVFCHQVTRLRNSNNRWCKISSASRTIGIRT
jgi:hypothetical protein